MDAYVKKERKILLLLALLFNFVVPAVILLWVLYARGTENDQTGYLSLISGCVGAAAVLLAARRYSYRQSLVFILPAVAQVVFIMFALGFTVNAEGLAPYIAALCGPFLYLAIERALAKSVKQEWLYVLLSVLLTSICSAVLAYLVSLVSNGTSMVAGSGLMSRLRQLFTLVACVRTALTLALEGGAYALLYVFLRRRTTPEDTQQNGLSADV